jgi:hypothetical protein
MYIDHLAEDVDAIRRVHWSPYSDVVVFETGVYLIAARVPDTKRSEYISGGNGGVQKLDIDPVGQQ